MSKIEQNFNSAYNDYLTRNKVLNQNNTSNQIPQTSQTPSIVVNVPDINQEKKLDKILKYSGLLALFLVPGAAVVSSKLTQKNLEKAQRAANQNANIEKTMQGIAAKLEEIVESSKKEAPKSNKTDFVYKTLGVLGGLSLAVGVKERLDKNEELSEDEKEQIVSAIDKERITQWNRLDELQNRVNNHEGWLQYIQNKDVNDLTHKYMTQNSFSLDVQETLPCYFSLLQNVEQKGGFNKEKYTQALKDIREVGKNYLNGVAQKDKPALKVGDTIWSITAEFDPIREGGLGNVPPDLQKNAKKLGMDMPTILPMYEPLGKAQIDVDANGKGIYNYDGTKFNVQKAAEFRTQICRKDVIEDTPVEIFVATTKIDKKTGKVVPLPGPIIFVRNSHYFDTLPYTASPKTEEPERMAFLSKTAYELAKMKINDELSPDSALPVSGFKVTNKEAYESFKAPAGMVLNDWHAAPVGALLRYKSKLESAAGKLDEKTAKALDNMRTLLICHNCAYQGQTEANNGFAQKRESSENILNTLFDCYAADIVSHADSGVEESSNDPENGSSNVFVLKKESDGDKFTNLLAMGIYTADCVCPVSQNYTKEIVDDKNSSKYVHSALELRQKASENKPNSEKNLCGVTNGNDFSNNSITAKKDFMKRKTGFESVNVEQADKEKDAKKFWLYGKDTPTTDLIKARNHNKILVYNDYIRKFALKQFDKKILEENKGMENLSGFIPPELSDDELLNTPLISNIGRMVTQKGFPTMAKAIKEVYRNWDKNHPDQPKPIFCLAGEDGEGGKIKEQVLKMQKEIEEEFGKETASRVIFYHGFAPSPVYMCASDFFSMTSIFEPCGLTQGEALALGTPVVATAVGGLVDTIETENKPEEGKYQYGFLADTGVIDDKNEAQVDEAAEIYAKSLDEALDVFYEKDKNTKYNQMIQESINFSQDWVKPDRVGPMYEYFELFGIDRKDLPELSEIK